jgi:hypothetical protein
MLNLEREGDGMRPEAGEPRKPRVQIGAACALGGSFAGLLAARVLADHAVRVTVLERDVSLDVDRPGNLGGPDTWEDAGS